MKSDVKIDYQGESVLGTELDFEVEKESFCVYRLPDGTRIRARGSLVRIVKVNDKLKDGKPIYVIAYGIMSQVEQPGEKLIVVPDSQE